MHLLQPFQKKKKDSSLNASLSEELDYAFLSATVKSLQ